MVFRIGVNLGDIVEEKSIFNKFGKEEYDQGAGALRESYKD
jgi:hypothetical protein